MKKILSVTLALIMALSTLSIATVSAEYDFDDTLVSGDYLYETLEDGTAAFNGYKGDYEEFIVPSEIEGLKVTRIHRMAFSEKRTLKTLTIPEGVTYIGFDAFSNCVNLETLNLPDSLQNMHYMYIDDTKLYKNPDNWEDGVLYIGNHLIDTTKDKIKGTYKVKEGTVSISMLAFDGCSELTEVILPESLKYIDQSVFRDCDNLKKINLTDNIELIGSYAFSSCPIEEIHIPSKLKTIDLGVFRGTAIDELTIPDTVECIGMHAFSNCDNLTKVTVPESVKKIEDGAFSFCDNLTELTIPENLEEIGGCICHYTPFHDNEDNWENGILYMGDVLVCINENSANISVKEGTRLLPSQAFSNNHKLVSVTLPESIEALSYCCFAFSYNLRSVKLPSNLKKISSGAFEDCVALESIVIPEGVTSIGENAFFNCTELKYIEIPKSVENFGDMALGYYNPYFEIDGMPVMMEEYPTLDGFVLAGYKDSPAEEYANKHNIKFEDLSAPTQFKYKDKVLELLSSCENPDDPTAMWHYEEVYEHFEDENTASPDYVLIKAYAGLVTEANFTYYFDDYVMYESSTSTPAEFGYFIYLPEENKIYTLVDAFENKVDNVYDVFTEGVLGDLTGDVNFDGKLNIKDTSLLQKHFAKMASVYGNFHTYYGYTDDIHAERIADFNHDGKLNIRDATAIQRRLAGIDLDDPNYEDFENIAYENSITHVDVTIDGKTYDLRSDEVMTVEVYLDCEDILSKLSFELKTNPDAIAPQKKGKDSKYLENHCPNIPSDSEIRDNTTYLYVQTPEGEYDFTEKKLLYTMDYKVHHDYDTKFDFSIHSATNTDGVTVCHRNNPLRNTDINLTYNVTFQRIPQG